MGKLVIFSNSQGMITHNHVSPMFALKMISQERGNDIQGWRFFTTQHIINCGEIVCSAYCGGLWNSYCKYCSLGTGKIEPERMRQEKRLL